jgi:hypothetical protein
MGRAMAKKTPTASTGKPAASYMCWRHQARLFWAAWGSLLDLSGREYPRLARIIHAQARDCERCTRGRAQAHQQFRR